MKTIAFNAYVGGTGCSMLVAYLAQMLAAMGKKVVAMDFDLESPSLHYHFFGARRHRGVVDFVGDFLKMGSIPGEVREYLQTVNIAGSACLHVLPAGTAPSNEYWEQLSRINWHDIKDSDGIGYPEILLELKYRIEDECQPDLLLIDTRSGVTRLSGILTTVLADTVVSLCTTDLRSIHGTTMMMNAFSETSRLRGQDPLRIMPILARITRDDAPWVEDITDLWTRTSNPQLVLNEGHPFMIRHCKQLGLGWIDTRWDPRLIEDYQRILNRLLA